MALLAIAIAVAIATSPDSFAYAFLTGRCHGDHPAPACTLKAMRRPRHAFGPVTFP